ncbi:MAG: lysophospholipid acyltransferase family protein [bacterium]
MRFKEIKKRFLLLTGNLLLTTVADLLCKSLRIRFNNLEAVTGLEKEKKNYIAAFWHGNMIVPWYVNRGRNFSALVSQSKDGELLAKILKKWEYDVIRGSSNIGGKEALDLMIEKAKSGYSVAITPDGPKGPAHKMKAGPVVVSKKTGIPLILMGTVFSKKKKLKSWDSFEVPMPFSRIDINYSDPIFIDGKLTYEETSVKIDEAEKLLNSLQKEC